MSSPVSLQDVARAAGVHRSTVSRVLSGKAAMARIAPATQARVSSVANQFGYVRKPPVIFPAAPKPPEHSGLIAPDAVPALEVTPVMEVATELLTPEVAPITEPVVAAEPAASVAPEGVNALEGDATVTGNPSPQSSPSRGEEGAGVPEPAVVVAPDAETGVGLEVSSEDVSQTVMP